MSNKRDLKAYVKYDGNGKMVAGSLILNKFKPQLGNWIEIDVYRCCSGGGSCSGFWINQTFNPENPDNLYAIGSGMDSKCNSFILITDYWTSPNNPNQDSPSNSLLQKFNDAGELVWNKVFDFAESGTDFNWIEAQTMTVDKDDNPICFLINSNYNTIIVKFDNDGNQLWSFVLNNSVVDREPVNSVAFDASNNIYISCQISDGGDSYISVKKISPSGVVLASKTIKPTDDQGSSSFITANSIGEVYLVTSHLFGANVYIIKLDSSLNEIWNKSVDVDNVFPYSVVLDADENIVFQIGNGAGSNSDPLYGTYVKISPEGDVIWTTKISNTVNPDYSLGTYQLNSDSNGNVYISSIYPQTPIPGYSGSSNGPIIIAKLLPDGSFEWAYVVDNPESIDGWYWYSPIAGKVVNNALILAYYDNVDPFNAQSFKLPLTAVADGVYGDYTFTNITNLWTTSSPAITLIDNTAIYADGPTDTVSLNYITFEGNTYTTINTPL